MHFHCMTNMATTQHKNPCLVMKFTNFCLLTQQMLHIKFEKDWPSSSREDVKARQTAHKGGCQPITMDYLSDSGDLEI